MKQAELSVLLIFEILTLRWTLAGDLTVSQWQLLIENNLLAGAEVFKSFLFKKIIEKILLKIIIFKKYFKISIWIKEYDENKY